MEKLGVRPGEPWRSQQLWAKVPWKTFRSVGRLAWGLLEAMEMADRNHDSGRSEKGNRQLQATLIQLYKAAKQFALDGGSWKAAWPLTGLRDPYERDEWGGSASELSVIAGYLKAKDQLRASIRKGLPTPKEDKQEDGDQPKEEAAEGQKPGGRGGGQGRRKRGGGRGRGAENA